MPRRGYPLSKSLKATTVLEARLSCGSLLEQVTQRNQQQTYKMELLYISGIFCCIQRQYIKYVWVVKKYWVLVNDVHAEVFTESTRMHSTYSEIQQNSWYIDGWTRQAGICHEANCIKACDEKSTWWIPGCSLYNSSNFSVHLKIFITKCWENVKDKNVKQKIKYMYIFKAYSTTFMELMFTF